MRGRMKSQGINLDQAKQETKGQNGSNKKESLASLFWYMYHSLEFNSFPKVSIPNFEFITNRQKVG